MGHRHTDRMKDAICSCGALLDSDGRWHEWTTTGYLLQCGLRTMLENERSTHFYRDSANIERMRRKRESLRGLIAQHRARLAVEAAERIAK